MKVSSTAKIAPSQLHEVLARFRSTHPARHVTVGGLPWQFITCGQGAETVVLLPGDTGLGEAWFPIILRLERAWRIIAPTYPLATTMPQLVEGVAGILDEERVVQAHLLGTSLGGCVAQCFVRARPDKVRSLVLSNTLVPHKARPAILRRRNRILDCLPLALRRDLSRRAIFKHLPTVPAMQRAFWRAYFSKFVTSHLTRESLLRQNDCLIDFGEHYSFSADDLVDWPGAVLILESDDDPLIGAAERENLKRVYPQAQVHTFHGAGHLTPVSRKGEYVSLVRRFLAEQVDKAPRCPV